MPSGIGFEVSEAIPAHGKNSVFLVFESQTEKFFSVSEKTNKMTTLREIYRFKRAVMRCDARSKSIELFSIENAEQLQNSF